ncbi:unnamed protein product [Peniophora sp. CBMAI 1063]|nr:unnamed protein product [Peniophora sp. CBMAI 1063]
MARISIFGLVAFASWASALTYKGADISSVPEVEAAGITYTDSGSAKAFEKIIVDHGANTARVRVWTSGTYDTDFAIAMGKRVKAAGMTLIVDLHYSDTWADSGHQAIPSGWPTDLDGLNTEIYTYTQSIVSQFDSAGATIDILQVGNEINDGLLWPVGRLSTEGFSPASQLINSAISGAKSVSSPKILIHLANGWDWSDLEWFFTGIFISGAFEASSLDIAGVSFYPFYGTDATLAALKSSLTNLANLIGKEIIVAETDWPVTCSGVTLSESVAVSAAGQVTWIEDITSVLDSLPNERGQGILYWEPGWIGNAALGSGCSDNLLVSGTGATRSSIGMFVDM